VPQYAGRKGHARKVSRQGPERPHGPVKLVPPTGSDYRRLCVPR
jgi:hypothetical protein